MSTSPSLLARIWKRLIYTGIPANAPAREARCVALMNAICIIGLLNSVALFFLVPSSGLTSSVVLAASFVALAILLALSYTGHGLLAAIGLSLSTTGLTVWQALSSGLASGVYYYLLPVILIPYLILPPQRDRTAALLALVPAVSYLALIVGYRFVSGLQYNQHLHPYDFAVTALGAAVALLFIGAYSRQVALNAEARLAMERQQSEALLQSLFPSSVVARLKAGEASLADQYQDVSVLIADIVGFTPLSETMSPESLVKLLDSIFSSFDELCDRHGVEKIKTMGDAYVAAAGLPVPCEDHAARLANLALAMLEAVRSLPARTKPAQPLQIRVGIASGSAIAGVIGKRAYAYEVWGEAASLAAVMEAEGVPGEVQLAEVTRNQLGIDYEVEPCKPVAFAGGSVATYRLKGRRADAANGLGSATASRRLPEVT